ncbi:MULTISPECIES: hypothetical protein [Streptomyces]|uniref:Terminase n=2 Tax=Streptomyces rimosus subsp. rimosus TaxID=132474 RepID=L8EVK2_STRR1|nr:MULTISPECIES: hypothetical protein [Streptomyces]KOG84153.1 hypothetical protein ADK78_00715 [Kitasatospora aureofaciens]MYT44936.1 hypothetical protein [Streptomyces sp. SID5471]KUJ43437.1 hypothetical protein ADK46_00700 [Streptomyces rimosus subsp. rimosus]QDA07198.1 hypothetical protein CTZ40_29060 [Streptomyces rimosus]QEV78476.1 hypothetical protein CP984_29020 [Streptomyces rimosus]
MVAADDGTWPLDFPTLYVVPDWIAQHCRLESVGGLVRGPQPFEMYDWQLRCTAHFYRVRTEARIGQLSTAFCFRRGQVVAPQKSGKGPWTAGITAAEAVGPVLFAGWAEGGEVHDCRSYGCGCGWVYEYEPGEPMGRPWSTPLIQITATSEDQTDNVYRPLQAMIRNGPLGELMRVGEQFIRLPNDGRIDVVTSSAQSRLGNPVTFVIQDETGIWTETNKMTKVATTQRRGLAGMSGRSLETTNGWDPSENSVAQKTAETQAKDVYRFHRLPPKGLSYRNKAERRKIHAHVYEGSRHIDLDAIEGEAAELLEKEPAEAERFFGNRLVAGMGTWLQQDRWDARTQVRELPERARVVLGFDGSDVDDWTGIRAETLDGYQFTPTYGPDARLAIWDPQDWQGQVPRLEVDAAVHDLFERYDVVRMYADPPYWETEVDTWADRYGDKRVVRWYTQRVVQMHAACERLLTDVTKAASSFGHDGCEITSLHVRNARKAARPSNRYVLRKASVLQKIDLAVCSVLAHEAAGDVIAAGEAKAKRRRGRGF